MSPVAATIVAGFRGPELGEVQSPPRPQVSFVFKDVQEKGGNTLEIRFAGKGGLAYQLVGQCFVPWDKKPENEALSIDSSTGPR
jgi:hypothetical protein